MLAYDSTRPALAAAMFSALLLTPNLAGATWPTDPAVNVPVSASPTRFTNPQVAAPDSCGGIIVAWEDVGTVGQLYVQRVDAFGQRRWALDGFPIAPSLAMQALFTDIAPDGAGGAYVTWSDQQVAVTMRDIFVQHVLSAGAVDPTWPAAGVAVCSAPQNQKYPRIVADGSGGAVVVWTDERGNVDFAPDLYAQRITSTGATLWAADGVPVIVAPGVLGISDLAPDGSGGVYVGWSDNRPGSFDVFGQHLEGIVGAQLWPAAGLNVCSQPGDQYDVAVASDAGDMLIAWDDLRGGSTRDVYAQKLAPNGANAWPLNGALVCGEPGDQVSPRIVSDGLGGAIIAWSDYRFNSFDNAIFAQRVGSAGSTLWTAGGVAVCTAPGRQLRLQIISDQLNGAIVTWDDFRKNYPQEDDVDVFAQRLSAAGTTLWTPDGAVVSSAVRNQVGPNIVTDGAGGAVIAWQDQRRLGDTDIYAQEIGATGLVGVRGASQNCAPEPCTQTYEDWGDAPEEPAAAYPGVIGRFPTCSLASTAGTRDVVCAPRSSTPGQTGYVRHVSSATDDFGFWLGCSANGTPAVDTEVDGKTNDSGLPASMCDPNVPVDCVEPSILTWGQDECYGDGVDAGLDPPWVSFNTCQMGTVDFRAFNCAEREVFLNILVDMNQDGDWNDNFECPSGCAYEWAVKNEPVVLPPGCSAHTSSAFPVGPNPGRGWLRITLTSSAVSDDFPWDGSTGPTGGGFFRGGETEDYLAVIRPGNVGVGDAPRPERLWLARPVPNPARDEILVRFALPHEADVALAAFDLAGRKLAELERGRLPAGEHRVTWNFRDASGREVGAGYYVIKLRVGDRVLTQRGIRVR